MTVTSCPIEFPIVGRTAVMGCCLTSVAQPTPMTPTFSVTPSLRYYTQNAASFYVDPVADTAVYPGPAGNPQYSSADQRLSAFGGVTVGLKLELQLGSWVTDLKLERYQQRSGWRLGGNGSPGIDAFDATIVQLGLGTSF